MTQTHQVDAPNLDRSNDPAPLAIGPFLVNCAICSVVGFTVLVGLTHSLLSFWGPVV